VDWVALPIDWVHQGHPSQEGLQKRRPDARIKLLRSPTVRPRWASARPRRRWWSTSLTLGMRWTRPDGRENLAPKWSGTPEAPAVV
jgi:hypothetical protein